MTILQQDEMVCPYCAEVIKKAAIVCKHCNRGLVDPASGQVATPEEARGITSQGLALKAAVDRYMTADWTVTGSTASSVQLRKRQPLNIIVLAFCLALSLLFGIGLILLVGYVWWWALSYANIVLTVTADGTVLRNGLPDPGPQDIPAPGQVNLFGTQKSTNKQAVTQTVPTREMTPEEAEKVKTTNRKMFLILGAVLLGFIILACLCSVISSLGNNNYAPSALLPVLSMLI